MDTLSTN